MAGGRLDRILSRHGFGTRRDARRLMGAGRVLVNGAAVRNPGFHFDMDADILCVDGAEIILKEHVYLMMNKPRNLVCAARDGLHGTVFDLLGDDYRRSFMGGSLHLVGRLDIDTEGLLLLTTDGTLTHRLLSPRTHVPKTYLAHLERAVPAAEQRRMRERFAEGIFVPREGNERGFEAQPAELSFDSETAARLVICEGKFHQVKRMFAAAGSTVTFLRRLAVGALRLDESLAPGGYRELSDEEISLLREPSAPPQAAPRIP